MRLILASNSPRRRDILTKHGYKFTVIKSDYNESESKDSVSTAVNNAKGKACDVFNKLEDKSGAVVLGADTVVFYGDEILGKPKDENDAVNILKKLSGKTHKVVTGYCVITCGETFCGYDESEVTFNVLSDDLIYKYVKSGLSMDKAGAYGIQDGFPIVKAYSGDLENIIGLPYKKIKDIIKTCDE